jgi:hypothetical protein
MTKPVTHGVGLARLELATSPLSGVRSNHLSYSPSSARMRLKAQGFKDRRRSVVEN